jgi:hypothetical protein
MTNPTESGTEGLLKLSAAYDAAVLIVGQPATDYLLGYGNMPQWNDDSKYEAQQALTKLGLLDGPLDFKKTPLGQAVSEMKRTERKAKAAQQREDLRKAAEAGITLLRSDSSLFTAFLKVRDEVSATVDMDDPTPGKRRFASQNEKILIANGLLTLNEHARRMEFTPVGNEILRMTTLDNTAAGVRDQVKKKLKPE